MQNFPKEAIIITPLHTPWDWSADYQKQTCLELAKNNKVIVYVQHQAHFFLKSAPRVSFPQHHNVTFYIPKYYLPFRQFSLVERVNQLLSFWILVLRVGYKKTIVWIFDYYFYFLSKRILGLRAFTIYDCVDSTFWGGTAQENRKGRIQEIELIKSADVFTVISHTLRAIHSQVRDAKIVPMGVTNYFSSEKANSFPLQNCVTYIGGINDRINWKLIVSVALQLKNVSFIFCGPIQLSGSRKKALLKIIIMCSKVPNITYLPQQERHELIPLLKKSRVLMIPYDSSKQANYFSFPMKLFEYFLAGRPVITTPIKELVRFVPLVTIASSTDEWVMSIKSLITHNWSKKNQEQQRLIALQNIWEHKVTVIKNLILNHKNFALKKNEIT